MIPVAFNPRFVALWWNSENTLHSSNSFREQTLIERTEGFNLGVTVQAREEDAFSYASNWTVTAIAICGGVFGAGLFTFFREGSYNPGSPKSRTANCLAGLSVLGAGFSLPGSTGKVALDDLFQCTAGTEATITAIASDSYADNWQIRVWLICVST